MQDKNIGILGNHSPAGFKVFFFEVERPVEKPRLPGGAPDLVFFDFATAVLKISPSQGARDRLGQLLKYKIVITANAYDMPGRYLVEPGSEVGVQPGSLIKWVVVGRRTNVAADQQQITTWYVRQMAVKIADRTYSHSVNVGDEAIIRQDREGKTEPKAGEWGLSTPRYCVESGC
jgi:plastocyanin